MPQAETCEWCAGPITRRLVRQNTGNSKCTVCRHSKRADIEQALGLGRSQREVASAFSVARASLHRHLGGHPLVRPLRGRKRRFCSDVCQDRSQGARDTAALRLAQGRELCDVCGSWHAAFGCRRICSWCLAPYIGSVRHRGRGDAHYCSLSCAAKAKWARETGQVWPGMVCHSGLHLYSFAASATRWCPGCKADASERTKAELGRLCECGCGSYTQRRNGYIQGHMPEVIKPKAPTKRDLLGTVCLCGCGQMTLSKTGYVGGEYSGHRSSNTVLCLCGCGSKSWSGIGFRQDHWRSLFTERPRTEHESESQRLNHRRRKARIKARAAALDGLLESLGIPMPKVTYPEGLPKNRRQEYRRHVKARLFVELEGRLDDEGT